MYDLNRSEEVVLTFLPDPKWINDFAVAKVIAALKNRITELETPDPRLAEKEAEGWRWWVNPYTDFDVTTKWEGTIHGVGKPPVVLDNFTTKQAAEAACIEYFLNLTEH